ATRAGTRTPAKQPAKVGSRAFNRRARQQAGRDPTAGQRQRADKPLGSPLAALARIPRAAWVCALVAFLSAACWSFITPPFQVPDEQDHFAYTQQLAETGQLP